MIDLRSDTLTRPTEAMLESMREATFGDDSRDGDETVQETRSDGRRAHRQGSRRLHAERHHGQPGRDARRTPSAAARCCWKTARTRLNAELGGIAGVAGLFYRGIPGKRGAMDLDALREAMRPDHPPPHGHRAGLDGEHPQPRRRRGAAARAHAGGARPRARKRRPGAPRRRAHLQRSNFAGRAAQRNCSVFRLGLLLRFEGTFRAGGIHPLRQRARSSSARAPTAAWSAATCARPGRSPPPGSSRWKPW